MNPAAQQLPNLTEKTSSEAIATLITYGFYPKATTVGGYQSFAHPDGSIVHIRPDGEIVRTGPKIRGVTGKSYRRRYDQHGNQIKFIPGAGTHGTGERLRL